jgi:hypothetical protein
MSDKDHIKELGKKARILENDFDKVTEEVSDYFEEYITMINSPKFATPVNFMFSNLCLDTLIAQLNTFADVARKLMDASRIISEGKSS